MQRLLDGLRDVPALLAQAHQVGVQCGLPCRPPQLGDEVPQGYQGGDQGGFRHAVNAVPVCNRARNQSLRGDRWLGRGGVGRGLGSDMLCTLCLHATHQSVESHCSWWDTHTLQTDSAPQKGTKAIGVVMGLKCRTSINLFGSCSFNPSPPPSDHIHNQGANHTSSAISCWDAGWLPQPWVEKLTLSLHTFKLQAYTVMVLR